MKIIFLSVFLFSINAKAWGPMGHKTVADLASDSLSSPAKKMLQEIFQGQSLSQISTWADEARNQPQYSYTSLWHYVSVPDGANFSHGQEQKADEIVNAIKNAITDFRTSNDPNLRKVSIKFLVHLMGDIHQPLHVGRVTDRGGNQISVVFNGKNYNLHSLWDSGLIDYQNMSYEQYLSKLRALSSSIEVANYDLETIMQENLSERAGVYDFKGRTISEEYYKKNLPLVDRGLIKAGKRLAMLLNELASN